MSAGRIDRHPARALTGTAWTARRPATRILYSLWIRLAVLGARSAPTTDNQPARRLRRDVRGGAPGWLAGGGALVLIVGAILDPRAATVAYLSAYMATLAIVIGTVLLIAVAHLSGAIWFVGLRRQGEAVIASTPVLAALGLPLVLAFVWQAHAGAVVRAAVYWVIWIGASELLLRASRRQDANVPDAAGRLSRLAAVSIPFVSLAMSLAAFDWMMSLSPEWSSTVYGAYYFAGGMLGALALSAVLAWRRRTNRCQFAPTPDHFHALGRLMLAFVLFWGYLWYAQFFIIWIADIPSEVGWYSVRLGGEWRGVVWLLLGGGFVIPLVVLLFRTAKRSPVVMASVGALLLAVHYLDLYWMIVPTLGGDWSWLVTVWYAGAIALVAGASAALALRRQRGTAVASAGHPLFEQWLRYQAR